MEKLHRSEGDINISPRRQKWQQENLNEETRVLLAEDEKYFLKQSLSTPCLNAMRCLRRDLDRRSPGTAVHGFPREQRPSGRLRQPGGDCRNQGTARPALLLHPALYEPGRRRSGPETHRDRPGGLEPGPLLSRRGRGDRHGPETRPDRHRPPQDDLHVGLLSRGLAGCDLHRRRVDLPPGHGAAAARHGTCARLPTNTAASTNAAAAAAAT